MKKQPMISTTFALTRVMEFWIKEDGEWVVRGAHYSPLKGGQGTTQVTP